MTQSQGRTVTERGDRQDVRSVDAAGGPDDAALNGSHGDVDGSMIDLVSFPYNKARQLHDEDIRIR